MPVFPFSGDTETDLHCPGTGSVSYTHLDVYKRQDGTVSVRSRFAGDEGVKPLDEFIAQITEEIRTKAIRKEEVEEEKK